MFIVTGANGFIGSALVWELNQANITDIICVDSVTPATRPELLKKRRYQKFVHTDDLFSVLEKEDLLSKTQCVFHMGACSSTTETDVNFLKKNNTEYTRRLFDLCTQYKVIYVYASSGAVYGDGKQGFRDVDDSDIFKPLNPYGWSKANFDVWATEQKRTPPHWYGLRFFNVYGPNEYHKGDMSSLVFKSYKQIQDSGQMKLFRSNTPQYADGMQMRDFVYVKDVTRWMLEIYQKGSIASGIYNMGYGQARPWLDLAKAVFTSLDKPLKINWIDIPENIRNQYQNFTEADISKLKAEGLSQPAWPLERGVSDYVQNYLMQADPYL